VLDVHKELLALIEIRDAAGARKVMDDHVKMIRARRVTEDAKAKHMSARHDGADCC
jgi:GntR family transcriptional repressor for pyruvate dehydrogenase complex